MKKKTIKKNAFTVSVGWNGVDVVPQTISSDGYYSLRSWQQNCHNLLNNKSYRIINAPTGSGKSYMMTLLSAEDMDNNPKLRTIVSVPQTVIAAGFKEQKVLLPNGKKIHWIAGNDLCNDNPTNGTTKTLIKFIEGPNGTHADRIALCTHATLLAVYKTLKRTNRLHLLKNLNIWIDEAHHVMNVDLEDVPDATLSNGIGEVITHLLKSKSNNVGLSTASFFRGDRCSLLTEKQEKNFTRFNLPYDEYLKNMKYMKSFSINFVLCGADWTKTIDEVISEKRCKDIIYIPHPMSVNSTGDKYNESDLIIKAYNKIYGGKRKDICPLTTVGKAKNPFNILNLVDEDCRDEKKEYINSLKKRPPEDLNAIITLGMFKEGADWVHANRGIVIGARESLVDMLQIIGRFFRDTPGKEHVEINILLPFSIDQIKDEDELKNNLNNYLKAIYSCLILENIFDPIKIKMPVTSQGGSTAGAVRQNYLSQMLPDEAKQISLIDDVGNELIKISTEAKESGKTIRVWDEYEKVINNILTDHGIDSHQEEIAQEIWAMFTRKTVKLKGMSVDAIDFDILKDVDPVDSVFDYTSGICGIDTFQKLRDALRLVKDFVSYDEAKNLIQSYNFTGKAQFFEKLYSGDIDHLDLPRDPQYSYTRSGEWTGWDEFLSKGKKRNYLNLDQFRIETKKLGITKRAQYEKAHKDKILDKSKFPVGASRYYFRNGQLESDSWHYLFDTTKSTFLELEEAKKFIKNNFPHIITEKDYKRAYTNKELPEFLPGDPYTVYLRRGTWISWKDFFERSKKYRKFGNFFTYEESKEYLKQFNFKNRQEFLQAVRSNKLDSKIPKDPQCVYNQKGTWISWGDFLGNNNTQIGFKYHDET